MCCNNTALMMSEYVKLKTGRELQECEKHCIDGNEGKQQEEAQLKAITVSQGSFCHTNLDLVLVIVF